MGQQSHQPDRTTSPSEFALIDGICDAFEAARNGDGPRPQIEDYLAKGSGAHDAQLFEHLFRLELEFDALDGLSDWDADKYRQRFPEYAAIIDRILQGDDTVDADASTPTNSTPEDNDPKPEPFSPGDMIFRYRLIRPLAPGAFGLVYLAEDTDLDRQVAIKIAHRLPRQRSHDLQLLEARLAAKFDHPHIVPVFDIGWLPDGRVFIVSKFIDGSDLRTRIQDYVDRPVDLAQLLAPIADALDYAHQRLIFHRDVKPANILVDQDEHAYLTDFGLALRADQRDDQVGAVAGTPAYMSPEQVRGESHLVDRRSDVFGLAAVLYEMATGQRPFPGVITKEVFAAVLAATPDPPTAINQDLPAEMERIILKGLRKHASDRFDSAAELASNLRAWCDGPADFSREADLNSPITPRGLSSYSDTDAGFFLRLIPGARSRDGLPESVEFWRERIESRVESRAFRIGVLYGPSGSGKSSLFKAGLQPHLRDTACCFVSASPDDTCEDLLRALQAEYAALEDTEDLVEALRLARSGALPRARKLLIVIDQFEQWLSATSDVESSPLVLALRQCDGVHTQAVLLVRDDFWASLTHCLQSLDVDLDAGNSAMIELFERPHARQVLTELGRGYGTLSERDVRLETHFPFVDNVLDEMLETGPLMPVRLALFSHAFRTRSWTVDSLQDSGGVEGVISKFLEETTAADPVLSQHQFACARILAALLPPPGTLIKDQPRSPAELSELSGVEPVECDRVLTTLASKYPIITTNERNATEEESTEVQLSHDYLVPIVRDWTAHKLQSTREGRVENLLTERASAWRTTASARALPSLWEWAQIHLFSRRSRWTDPARQVMAAAGRWHLSRLGIALAAATMVTALTLHFWNDWRADRDVSLLPRVEPTALQAAVLRTQTSSYAQSKLRQRLAELLRTPEANADRVAEATRYRLGLLHRDPETHADAVWQYLGLGDVRPEQIATPDEVASIARIITSDGESSVPANWRARLWEAFRTGTQGEEDTRRAAVLLSHLDPEANYSSEIQDRVVRAFAASPPFELAAWMDACDPTLPQMAPAMQKLLDEELSEAQADNLAYLIARAATPEQLAASVPKLNASQLEKVMPAVKRHPEIAAALKQLWADLVRQTGPVVADEKTVSRIQDLVAEYQGAAAPHAGFAFSVPEAAAPELLATIADFGFQPVCYRPYELKGDLLVALAWQYGVAPYELGRDLDTTSLDTLNQKRLDQGLRLIDITHYENAHREPRLAALWLHGTEPTRVYVDQQRSLFRAVDDEGEDHFAARLAGYYATATRRHYSTIWLQAAPTQQPPNPGLGSSAENDFSDQLPGFLLTDVQLLRPTLHGVDAETVLKLVADDAPVSDALRTEVRKTLDSGMDAFDANVALQDRLLAEMGKGVRCLSTWSDTDDTESTLVWEQSLDADLARCRQLLTEGWRPHALAARVSRPGTLRRASVWHRSFEPIASRIEQAHAAANIAISLAELDDPAKLQTLFSDRLGSVSNRQARTFALERVPHYQRTSAWCAKQLETLTVDDGTMLRNTLLAISNLALDGTSAPVASAAAVHKESPDAAISSAARFCLRQLDQPVTSPANQEREGWFTNSLGQRLIRVAAPASGAIMMGAPCWDPDFHDREVLHKRALIRDYALGSCEVTQEAFAKFLEDPRVQQYYETHLSEPEAYPENLSGLGSPQNGIRYFDAILFCQWLSETEGLPESDWCYPGLFDGPPANVKLPENLLERLGYRLPTEAEWEWAARADWHEPRSFGPAASSLPFRSWGRSNSGDRAHPVGTRFPNALGFFDMLGNLSEWCHDAYRPWHDPPSASPERDLDLVGGERAYRGGSFDSQPHDLRPAHRASWKPDQKNETMGFRIAKTLAE